MSTLSPAYPGAAAVLSALHDHGLTIAVDGHDLVITPRHLLTPALRAAVVAHKPALLILLTTETGASSPAVERQAQQQGESHVPGAADTHSLVALLSDLGGTSITVVATIPEAQRLFYAGTAAYVSYEVRLLAAYRASYPEHGTAMVQAVHAAKRQGGVIVELYPPDAARQLWFSYYPPAPTPDPPAAPPQTPASSAPSQPLLAVSLGASAPHGEVPSQRKARR